ncbi:MAG: efflux RND transporter periplasmic adaptor subunit [Alphaproteobacteria bacterium]|nr:efflux RND transporter periplasmic adaptor subunit [Alphaproteobacteria bacterium]
MKPIFLVLGGLAAVVAGGVALSRMKGEGPQPVVAAHAAAPRDGRVYGLGTVEARLLSRLGFEAAGTLSEILVDQGDRVTKGQVLARLGLADQQARVSQAEAGVRQAQAALVQANARLDRARATRDQRASVNQRRQTLASRGTVSVEAAEDAQATSAVAVADVAVAASDVEAAKGGIESAVAKLALERALLDKLTLVAPFDALVIERARELGSAVAPGGTVLTIADPATIWVTAFIDEALAGRVEVGQVAEISLRSRPGQPLAGKVARIDLENDRVSEERRVQVAFDTPLAPFTLGEQAEVLISAKRP